MHIGGRSGWKGSPTKVSTRRKRRRTALELLVFSGVIAQK
jgi:hypothetical protein